MSAAHELGQVACNSRRLQTEPDGTKSSLRATWFSLLLVEERDGAAAPSEGHPFSFGSNEKMGRLVQSGLSRCDRAIDEIVPRGGRIWWT